MKKPWKPWLAAGSDRERGCFLNWGSSEHSIDNLGGLVIRGKTVGGISFKEIVSFIAGVLKKVTPPFATALLGI